MLKKKLLTKRKAAYDKAMREYTALKNKAEQLSLLFNEPA